MGRHALYAALACLAVDCAHSASLSFVQNRSVARHNPQIGFAMETPSWSKGGTPYDKNQVFWADGSFEFIKVGWKTIMPNRSFVDTDYIANKLVGLADRGKQAVIRVQIHRTAYHANKSNSDLPEFLLTELVASGYEFCRDQARWDYSSTSGNFVMRYDNELVLSAIEQTYTALGAALNGDPRIFAVEVGFVGYDGQWLHGIETTPNWRCPLPSPASASRIIKAAATAFSRTFVLMNRPWNAPDFPYQNYPTLGVADATFATGFPYLEYLEKVGLGERWKAAPVFATIEETLTSCWFSADPKTLCAERGVSSNVSLYADEVASRHVVGVVSPFLYDIHRDDNATQARIETAFLSTGGSFLHIDHISISTLTQFLSICAVVENIGSAPFYAPVHSPLKLTVRVGTGVYELKSSGAEIAGLMPNEKRIFVADTIPFFQVTDECLEFGRICTDAGQKCLDKDTSPFTRNDWVCQCPGGGFEERARPAVCTHTTSYSDDTLRWYDRTVPLQNRTIGTFAEHSMVDASFTVSLSVFLPLCPSDGCSDNDVTTTYKWDRQWLFSSTTKPPRAAAGFSMVWEGTDFRSRIYGKNCYAKPIAVAQPGNNWVHFATTYNKVTKTMTNYVDGVVFAECLDYPAVTDLAGSIRVGGSWEADSTLVGYMKDLRILNGALTQAEVVVLGAAREEYLSPVQATIRLETDFVLPKKNAVLFASEGANLTSGVVTLTIPQSTSQTNAQCSAGETEAPTSMTPIIISDPATLDVSMCAKVEVLSDGLPCGGKEFNRVGYSNWMHTEAGITREIWPVANSTNVSCTTSGGGPNSHSLLLMNQTTWGARARCTFTSAVSTPVPPTPSPPTPAPDTTAPLTSAPDTIVPTVSPPTSAPETGAPPTAYPGIPETNPPQTAAPPSEIPATKAPGGTWQPSVAPVVVEATEVPEVPANVTEIPKTGEPQVGGAGGPGRAAGEEVGGEGDDSVEASHWSFVLVAVLCGVVGLACAAAWYLAYKKKRLMQEAVAKREKWTTEQNPDFSMAKMQSMIDDDGAEMQLGGSNVSLEAVPLGGSAPLGGSNHFTSLNSPTFGNTAAVDPLSDHYTL